MTIIGVIAALTIPNLLQKYQEEALKTAYKKTYNTLNNAYKMVIAENGPMDCHYYYINNTMQYDKITTQGCIAFWDKFFNALKVAKKCPNQALQNGCLPANGYKEGKNVLTESGKTEEAATQAVTSGCPYIQKNWIENNLPAVVLSDGQIIIYTPARNLIFVDINGKKGPNKWGYDLFTLDIRQNRLTTIPVIYQGDTACTIKETGGKTSTEMYRSVILNK